MTLYARGYRKHEQGLDGKGPRWLPILSEGYRDAVKGKAFRRFTPRCSRSSWSSTASGSTSARTRS